MGNMDKITFLFGAGASCNALPIVKKIPERLKALIDALGSTALSLPNNRTYEDLKIDSPKSQREYQLEMIEDLKWLLAESQRHSSVDTLAKKLTIRRQFADLERLKVALSVFFIFEQAQNKPDNRYDSFYASIINSEGAFPENLRIISWNYDYQFELSYAEYSGQKKIYDNARQLNVIQKMGVRMGFNQGFRIYKLNGTTELFTPQLYRQFSYVEEFSSEVDNRFVEKVVRGFATATNSKNLSSTLSFAWESGLQFKENDDFINSIVEDIKDSVVLVVIGYSFPFFNREIDRKIINSMALRKVYFQSPEANSLKERFKAIRFDMVDSDLILVKDVKQFLLPNEL